MDTAIGNTPNQGRRDLERTGHIEWSAKGGQMNKSSTSSQLISLPTGGGALHGIGETFSPDLHTGTGNFTVPIALPPGPNGFQPQLNLVYSTGNGNGPFGLGWGLSIPGVSRKTSRGIPRYTDRTEYRQAGLALCNYALLSSIENSQRLTASDSDGTPQCKRRISSLTAIVLE